MNIGIQIEQRAGDGSVIGSLTVAPGHSFVIRGEQAALDAVASQTIHAFKALGAADVILEAISGALAPASSPALPPASQPEQPSEFR